MKIDAFKTLVQQGGAGRVTSTDGGQTFQSIQTRLGGIGKVVKDFFIRVHGETRHAQHQENKTTRHNLSIALKQAYGARIPEKTYDKLVADPSKPISTSEIKKLINKGEQQKNMVVNLPGTNKPVTLAPSTFSPSTLSKIPDLQSKIQAKINNGHAIVRDVMNGSRGPESPPTHKEVTDMVWFLHATAEEKVGQSFKDGALTIKDDGQLLRKFLDKCPDVYERISSHIKGFTESEHGGHRGIDTPKGETVDDILPHGHMTLLYGTMTANDNTPLHSDMLYFKIESHGCYLAPPKDENRDGDVQSRGQRPHDRAHFRGHALSFFATLKARLTGNQAQGTYKERIPSTISKPYQALIDSAKKNGSDRLVEILKQNNPMGTAGGIRVMLQNIEQARNELNLPNHFDAFENLVRERHGDTKDNIRYRIGDEVILGHSDLMGTVG